MFPDIAKCPLGDKVTPDRNHWVELYSGPKDGNGAPPSLGLTRNVEGRAWSCLKETDGLAKCLSLFGPGILRLYPSVDSHGGISSLSSPWNFLAFGKGRLTNKTTYTWKKLQYRLPFTFPGAPGASLTYQMERASWKELSHGAPQSWMKIQTTFTSLGSKGTPHPTFGSCPSHPSFMGPSRHSTVSQPTPPVYPSTTSPHTHVLSHPPVSTIFIHLPYLPPPTSPSSIQPTPSNLTKEQMKTE